LSSDNQDIFLIANVCYFVSRIQSPSRRNLMKQPEIGENV